MPKTTLERIEAKVEIDPVTKCWIWTGAFKNARPNLYVVNERQFSLPPRPWMRDGKSFNHPMRVLKQPPKGRRLIRLCERLSVLDEDGQPIPGSPFCCNPDHWTYPGEVIETPKLIMARQRFFEDGFTLDDIYALYGDEIGDQIKQEDF